MNDIKFDPKKLKKLNNPNRLKDIPPDVIGEKLRMGKASVFVDLGAGTAFFSLAFFRKFMPAKIYACDVSDVMIEWMKENVTPEFPDIIPVKTREHSVPLDNCIADLVFMINLHHELETPELTLEESKRLLKPGGKILIVDWKKKEMPDGPPERIRYLPEQVEAQLESAGFQHVEIFSELPKHFIVIGEKVRL